MKLQSTVNFCLTTVLFVLLGAIHLSHAGDDLRPSTSGGSAANGPTYCVHAFDFERWGVHSVEAPAGEPSKFIAVYNARYACYVDIDNLYQTIVNLGGIDVQIEIEDEGVLSISDVKHFHVGDTWEKYIVAEYFVSGNITYVDASGRNIQTVLMIESH